MYKRYGHVSYIENILICTFEKCLTGVEGVSKKCMSVSRVTASDTNSFIVEIFMLHHVEVFALHCVLL